MAQEKRASYLRISISNFSSLSALAVMERSSIGFKEQSHHTDGMGAIQKTFTPEFRNRLDAIIQFESLSEETISRVVDKFLEDLSKRLGEKEVTFFADQAARTWLCEKGYDKKMGARPMARLIQEHLKKPLADELLFGKLSMGGHVEVTADAQGIQLTVTEEASKEVD